MKFIAEKEIGVSLAQKIEFGGRGGGGDEDILHHASHSSHTAHASHTTHASHAGGSRGSFLLDFCNNKSRSITRRIYSV